MVLLLGFTSASQAGAYLPAFYGKDYVRQGFTWPDGRSVEYPGPSLPYSSYSEVSYKDSINKTELAQGPYADTLTEQLLSLARFHQNRGEHEEANNLYRRALHIVRINDGLYSVRQAPVVRALLDSYRAEGDMQALDEHYDYFFRLYGNGKPPYTGLRMNANLEYLRWQREAIRLEVDSNEKRRLLRLYQLNENILLASSEDESQSLADLWRLTLSQIRNLYLVQSKITPVSALSGFGTSNHYSPSPVPLEKMDLDQQRLERIVRTIFDSGREILEHAIALARIENDAMVEARATLELGDWNQWNGRYNQANAHYRQLVSLLGQAGQDALVVQWFGVPVELPDNGAYWQFRPPYPNQTPIVIRASFEVSARGRVRKLVAEVAQAENRRSLSQFKRKIGATRFRPQFVNGQAVTSARLTRDYEIVPL